MLNFKNNAFYLLLLTLFICNTGFVYAHASNVAIGTYEIHDNIQNPLLIQTDTNNLWAFAPISLESEDNGSYLYNLTSSNGNSISTGAIETQRYYWPQNHRRPLFIVKNQTDKSWSIVKNIANLPAMEDGIAPSISCVENTCFAVGWYHIHSYETYPLLLQSKNSGNDWSYVSNIPTLPKESDLTAITCSHDQCIAVGTYTNQTSSNESPLILMTHDQGKSWTSIQDVTDFPESSLTTLQKITCQNNFCVIAGNYSTHEDSEYYDHALLITSNDGGKSWKVIKELPQLTNMDFLQIDDLVFSNGSFIAVGGYSKKGTHANSLILKSDNNGDIWNLIQTVDGSPTKTAGWLKNINCQDNLCIAGGSAFYIGALKFRMTLLTSKDNGQTWTLAPQIAELNYTPDINQVNCTDQTCTAIGEYTDQFDYSHPVLLTSNDQGKSWALQNILNTPNEIYKINFSSFGI